MPENLTPQLTREQVEHVALLARVGLSQDDIERFRHQLSRVLEHFEVLSELDTEGIPPTAQVVSLQNVLRRDESSPSMSQSETLANAPQVEDGCFKVRAVLEE
ncbi:MAG: Asp-tRNA(Asn)/Glu-tRNA(Gln) amidotransferase subunit GatC [Dehalococcoidia bacterium]|nr:Asp-tRNA(Asn)/Glu-tRNA(Gln) amidotransferase subunit GatC [Dehalococcoidia bacterium]